VASGYIEESMASKNKISRLIGTGNGEAGTSRETGTSGENFIKKFYAKLMPPT
jgi:hypothetical protein